MKFIEADAPVIPPPLQPEPSTTSTTTFTTATFTTATFTTTAVTTTTTSAITTLVPTTAATTSTTTSTTSTTTSTKAPASQCNKLRGGKIKPEGFNDCRIYMKKSSTKGDCRRFVRKMKAMNNDSKNNMQFVVKNVGHHKERSMILAELNRPALDKV